MRQHHIMPRIGKHAALGGQRHHRRAALERPNGLVIALGHAVMQAIRLGDVFPQRIGGAHIAVPRHLAQGVIPGGIIPQHQRQETDEIPLGCKDIPGMGAEAMAFIQRAGAQRIAALGQTGNGGELLWGHQLSHRHGDGRRAAAGIPEGTAVFHIGMLINQAAPEPVILGVIAHRPLARHLHQPGNGFLPGEERLGGQQRIRPCKRRASPQKNADDDANQHWFSAKSAHLLNPFPLRKAKTNYSSSSSSGSSAL